MSWSCSDRSPASETPDSTVKVDGNVVPGPDTVGPRRDAGLGSPDVKPSVDFGPILSGAVDILFMVDNSNSMEQEQKNLADNFRKMLDGLEINGQLPDLRIGVISSDLGAGNYGLPSCEMAGGDGGKLQTKPRVAGCIRPTEPWISYSHGVTNIPGATGDPEVQLATAFACIAELGAGGCAFENQLESARRALDPALQVNPGFIRSGALLAVVFVTDEDDCSAQNTQLYDPAQQGLTDPLGPLTSFRCTAFGLVCDQSDLRAAGPKTHCKPGLDWLYKVEDYSTFFQGLKPAGRVIVAAIAGPTEPFEVGVEGQNPVLKPTCQGINGGAVPAIRIKSVIDSLGSNGLFNKGIDDQGHPVDVNICATDFGLSMRALAQAISKAL
jgi:hypothetical protein